MTVPTMIEGLDRATVLEWFRRIDEGPYATLALGERIAYPNLELFTTLAAAAATTARVQLMATVVVLPAHPAIEVAKMAATIDVLSAGRLRLGVGIGGRDEDYRALQAPFDHRHQRLDDQVVTMQRVWRGLEPMVDMHPVGPRPVQREGIPLWSGALGPKAIARSARWATGVAGFVLDPLTERMDRTVRAIHQAWTDAGRDEPPHVTTSFWYALGPEGPTRLQAYAQRYLGIFGAELAGAMAASCSIDSIGALGRALDLAQEAGFDEVILVPTSPDPRELDAVEELLAERV